MAMDPEIPDDESRRKRVKVSDEQPMTTPTTTAAQATFAGEQASKEAEVGITNFVSADVSGFSGLVKKRYTDFLVNEKPPSGIVLHLQNLSVPSSLKGEAQSEKKKEKPDEGQTSRAQTTDSPAEQQQDGDASQKVADEAAEFTISDDDKNFLSERLGADVMEQVIALHRRALSTGQTKPSKVGKVKSGPIADKEARTQLHQATRRIFSSRVETTTEDDGGILFSTTSRRRGGCPGNNNPREGRKGKVGWDEVGGEYLHFTIHKENRDTMEVISFLARQMRLSQKNFQFAGTKDRRGVTVQRASVYRVSVDRLIGAGKTLRNATLGDFEYQKQGLELGELEGNEFVVTLRECEFADETVRTLAGSERVSKASEIVSKSLHDLYERGYFNYYGLQRFGTFATRTDMVGVKMLQGDFCGACDLIMHFSPTILDAAQNADADPTVLVSSEDKARGEAIHIFQTTGKINEALDKMPKKFTAECSLIKQLGRSKNDYLGALQTIPRNLRLMYVHAYQSRVWNFAVGERWLLYGDKVVAGDLVLANEHKHKGAGLEASAATEQLDADGDAIVLPDAGDSASSADDVFLRARALSADEAASGTYSIFDIVLPLPGFDVVYPPNEMTEFYKRFMASEQGGKLDPFDMRRKWKDVSLSGSYRKILSRPGPDFSFEVKSYTDDIEQFVVTDLERLRNGDATKDETRDDESRSETPDKLAVVVKFQLGASQYATIALRELTKNGARPYKADFGLARS